MEEETKLGENPTSSSSTTEKPQPAFGFGQAAFILIRVKRAFKKRRAKLKR